MTSQETLTPSTLCRSYRQGWEVSLREFDAQQTSANDPMISGIQQDHTAEICENPYPQPIIFTLDGLSSALTIDKQSYEFSSSI